MASNTDKDLNYAYKFSQLPDWAPKNGEFAEVRWPTEYDRASSNSHFQAVFEESPLLFAVNHDGTTVWIAHSKCDLCVSTKQFCDRQDPTCERCRSPSFRACQYSKPWVILDTKRFSRKLTGKIPEAHNEAHNEKHNENIVRLPEEAFTITRSGRKSQHTYGQAKDLEATLMECIQQETPPPSIPAQPLKNNRLRRKSEPLKKRVLETPVKIIIKKRNISDVGVSLISELVTGPKRRKKQPPNSIAPSSFSVPSELRANTYDPEPALGLNATIASHVSRSPPTSLKGKFVPQGGLGEHHTPTWTNAHLLQDWNWALPAPPGSKWVTTNPARRQVAAAKTSVPIKPPIWFSVRS